MSLFEQQTVPCPACSHSQTIDVAFSLNASRRPICDRRSSTEPTSVSPAKSAALGFTVNRTSAYLDIRRNQWFLAKPVQDVKHWSEFETAAQVIFDGSVRRPGAGRRPERRRRSASASRVRLDGTREKLLYHEAGLDDVTLELVQAHAAPLARNVAAGRQLRAPVRDAGRRRSGIPLVRG